MTTLAIIQARMGSTRFPGKVMEDLGGRPVLQWIVRAARAIPGIDETIVATSTAKEDGEISDWCRRNDIKCFRGSELDVLSRFAGAAKTESADTIMRLTADCPLLDPQVCGTVLALFKECKANYASNCSPANWPDGLDCEVFSAKALFEAYKEAVLPIEREHVTPFIHANRKRYAIRSVPCPIPGRQDDRWTLDYPEDLEFLRQVVRHLAGDRPPSYLEVLRVLERMPSLREINSSVGRNAGFLRSIAEQPAEPERCYRQSRKLLDRALKSIPLGTQTFSKSHIQYPEKAPLFLTYGDGGCVWDVDANRYVDLVMGLLPVVLGYRDPDVDRAIANQLANGISFSLATELEVVLAEKLIEVIPSAEAVRFGKNGTDATSAAVRLARAFTGRDRIMASGYHGWQDWYIGATTRNKGVPKAVSDLTHMVPYNDIRAVRDLLRKHPGEFAALIMEPVNATEPGPGYFDELHEMLLANGVLLIFDEIITGFRYALGGAQELYGVKPDLSCFGKALGNGMPISAVTGRADVMREMEDIFFSGTFGGETLSIAAAIAVIEKMQREPVIETLWETGKRLSGPVAGKIADKGLGDVLSLRGAAPWTLLDFKGHPKARKEIIRSVFVQEMLRHGVLISGSHNVCYAHGAQDVAVVLRAYDAALDVIAGGLSAGSLEKSLSGPPIEPIFKVR